MRTCIDILEFPSTVGSGHEPVWANLYKHKKQIDIVSASLNGHRNLLAFTARLQPDGKLKGHVDSGTDSKMLIKNCFVFNCYNLDAAVYEAFIAEIAEEGACFSLSILTLAPQSLRV